MDIVVTVNGRPRDASGIAASTTALDWLRSLGLIGAKEGCAEGECGACAVLLATPDDDGGTAWTAVNACLMPAAALDGQEVVTAEGLGTPERMHPVQAALAEAGGSQCGYCTPGFACSMAAEFYRARGGADAAASVRTSADGGNGAAAGASEAPAAERFDLHALSGNLCRCTGYRPIRDAALGMEATPGADDPLAERRTRPAPAARATRLAGEGGRFVRPESLDEALALLHVEPDAVPIAGCTDWGVEANLRGRRAPLVVAIDRLPELRAFVEDDAGVDLGAALTLTEIEHRLGGRAPLLAALFPQFASPLIRNRATLGGNLGTASPIGDAPPALLALEARLVLASPDGEREVDLAEYFTGYRETVRRPGELIRTIRIPQPTANLTAFHKVAKRRYDDISSVAVAFAIDLDEERGTVASARIGLGGVAATPIRARATEAALVGREWTEDAVREAASVLGGEGTPMSDHRASAEYRAAMLEQALLRLHRRTVREGVPA
ncbi:dehydrogenase [Agromyces luteolus]|uniref:2Fe-2S iron-sulfur cluster binding domain-containing protein n=1 Tax=Agromyces luteolus TaxID=88373 RepID=A0A7C9HIH2_9MICO|nr:FAD binding domain-containing protein [Agromyces luteolus]MUN07827.1 2Fe-2S iron-sulfur cluster binding domain-containing protein [Agromyces luteolus]GLK29178.1 dehydrogenase [Agromyces luteolus]